jgi:hypothetical protein
MQAGLRQPPVGAQMSPAGQAPPSQLVETQLPATHTALPLHVTPTQVSAMQLPLVPQTSPLGQTLPPQLVE